MKQTVQKVLSVLLVLLTLSVLTVSASSLEGFYSEKTAAQNEDGTYAVTLKAYQTGRVVPTDIVMVLDVSGSMECSEPVPYAQIDPAKTYCIKYVRTVWENGKEIHKQYIIPVHNIAPEGEEAQWYGQLEESGPEQQVFPKIAEETGTYTFYTGALEPLKAAATAFAQSIAQNAEKYDADHRIAVVEFSSPVKKDDASLCTHANPYYANILSADNAQSALLDAKANSAKLADIFASLKAKGPTYSDDAMAQAESILRLNRQSGRNQAVILFTDGGPGSYGWGKYDLDGSALPTANGAIACAGRMKANGVKVYTIGVFNSENLDGEIGRQNTQYLNCVSSNYPEARSMSDSGEKANDGYCSIGGLQMDLSGVFADISSVIGEPVRSASVVDTVSRSFYLTAAQKQTILERFPDASIVEADSGETTIRIPDMDLPPVATDSSGNPVNTADEGIFELTFSVTARAEFLGGNDVATNSGVCGVFTQDGVQLAAFAQPSVRVPVSEAALDRFLETKSPDDLYCGDTLRAQDLYVDKSDGWAAEYARVRYSVTDAEGKPFTEGVPTENTVYTVRADITVGGETYTRTRTVTVTPVKAVRMTIQSLPDVTTYAYKSSPDFRGLTVEITYSNGTQKTVDDLSALQIKPQSDKRVRRGEQRYAVSAEGVSATFPMQVKLTLWQWLILIFLFGWIWY